MTCTKASANTMGKSLSIQKGIVSSLSIANMNRIRKALNFDL